MNGSTFGYAFGCFASAWLLFFGYILRNTDFADLMRSPFKKSDDIYISGTLPIKDTPENRKKINKIIKTFWVSFSSIIFVVSTTGLIVSLF